MINYFKIIALVLCINEVVFGLRVRVPSIFGRRVSNIDESLRSAFEMSGVVADVMDSVPLNKIKVSRQKIINLYTKKLQLSDISQR